MAGKTTDRKSKSKTNPDQDFIDSFTLPDSLSCSEIDFPILVKKRKKVKWHTIVKEHEEWMRKIQDYEDSKKEPMWQSPFKNTECDYLKNEVFPYLMPALEETLRKAKIWDALYRQKCFFNGIDHIVQELWNNNPRHTDRKVRNDHLFNMHWVREELKENPRPYYPKSWLWPDQYAATVIQKTVRQYFVQREDEVQEMRDFWRKLKVEKTNPHIEANPLLAKRFASFRQ